MRKLIVVIGVLLFAVGCMQEKSVYTINPDLSGKLVYSRVEALKNSGLSMTIGDQEEQDLQAMARAKVEALISTAQGVSAWKDIHFEVTDTEKLSFQGTAYFSDFNALDLNPNITASHGLVLERLQSGALQVRLEKTKKDDATEKNPPATDLTDEDVARRVAARREELKRTLAVMKVMLAGYRKEAILNLPASIAERKGFPKSDTDRQIVFVEDGDKTFAAMEEIFADDEIMARMVQQGVDGMESPPVELEAKVFGASLPLVATTGKTVEPQFDYAAEVKAAKEAYPEMLKRLGLQVVQESDIIQAPASGKGFSDLRITGVRLVSEVPEGASVLSSFNPGYSIGLVGVFDGAILSAEDGVVNVAETVEGESLLPEKKWDQKIRFPRLTDDKRHVTFTVNLLPPPAGSAGIRRVAGTMDFLVASGTKVHDLGGMPLRTGATGAALNAEFTEVEVDAQANPVSTQVELKIHYAREHIKEVRFADTNGAPLDFSKRGYSSSNKITSLRFDHEGKLPDAIAVEVEVYDPVKQYSIPWEITGINWFGEPLPPAGTAAP